MRIRFNYADRKLNYSPTSSLKKMVECVFYTERINCLEIDYIFCSDEYLLQINKSMLNHDYYTDILTFPLSLTNEPIQAEIYISIDRVKENAKIHNTTYINEIARVLVHGALHLCGYKDKSKKEIGIMREKEAFYIDKL